MNREKYIENDALCLAEVIESDYKVLYDSWNDEDTVWGYNYKLPHTFEEYCQNAEKAETWGAVIMRREDSAIIGRIGISAGLPDLTITIFKPYRSQSYGTAAFLLGVKYCFDALKLDKIYAGSYEDNIASRKMIERCGFKPNPDGNDVEPHIFSGEDRLQLDFVIENPRGGEAVTGVKNDFWIALDKLVSESTVIINRPKGSRHPKYPDCVYPVDYGYLEGTASMDGGGIDVWKGSDGDYIDAVICTVDLLKRDSEIKILIGCSEEEKQLVLPSGEYMNGILIRRETLEIIV